MGFSDSSIGKESTYVSGNPSSIPGLGRSSVHSLSLSGWEMGETASASPAGEDLIG